MVTLPTNLTWSGLFLEVRLRLSMDYFFKYFFFFLSKISYALN